MAEPVRKPRLAEKPHVLVVDDDERLRQLLSRYLTEHDFLVVTAVDAKDARAKLKSLLFDLIVLDVMMPGEDGLSLTSALKKEITTPILLLTAKGETSDRIKGLEAGADDYLPKPFEPKELVLRIHAILRRIPKEQVQKTFERFGDWQFDAERGEIFDTEKRVSLTAAETTLLKSLLSRKGEVISREDLAEMCSVSAQERTIDVQVTRLRRKIEKESKNPRHLQTVRGKGYVLWPD